MARLTLSSAMNPRNAPHPISADCVAIWAIRIGPPTDWLKGVFPVITCQICLTNKTATFPISSTPFGSA